MTDRRRTWLRLDAAFYADPRLCAVSPQAQLLYLRGLGYCKLHETGGLITLSAFRTFSAPLRHPHSLASALVLQGLWQPTDNGWTLPRHTWDKWQTSGPAQTPKVPRVRARARARVHDLRQTRPEQNRD